MCEAAEYTAADYSHRYSSSGDESAPREADSVYIFVVDYSQDVAAEDSSVNEITRERYKPPSATTTSACADGAPLRGQVQEEGDGEGDGGVLEDSSCVFMASALLDDSDDLVYQGEEYGDDILYDGEHCAF